MKPIKHANIMQREVIGLNVTYLEQGKVGKLEVDIVEEGKDKPAWDHSFPKRRE